MGVRSIYHQPPNFTARRRYSTVPCGFQFAENAVWAKLGWQSSAHPAASWSRGLMGRAPAPRGSTSVYRFLRFTSLTHAPRSGQPLPGATATAALAVAQEGYATIATSAADGGQAEVGFLAVPRHPGRCRGDSERRSG